MREHLHNKSHRIDTRLHGEPEPTPPPNDSRKTPVHSSSNKLQAWTQSSKRETYKPRGAHARLLLSSSCETALDASTGKVRGSNSILPSQE